jgi:hypothetical protein
VGIWTTYWAIIVYAARPNEQMRDPSAVVCFTERNSSKRGGLNDASSEKTHGDDWYAMSYAIRQQDWLHSLKTPIRLKSEESHGSAVVSLLNCNNP